MKTEKPTVLITILALLAFALVLFSCTNYPVFERDTIPLDWDEYRIRYPDIKFGDDGNTILLEIEWHSYETALEEYLPSIKNYYDEYRQSEEYMQKSAGYKKNYDEYADNHIDLVGQWVESVKEGRFHIPRYIDGKKPPLFVSTFGIYMARQFDLYTICTQVTKT